MLTRMRVGFADVTLDAGAMELARAGERVAVEPQVMEVLTYLVAHRERVVPKTELLDEIWGDRFVSELALSSRIKSARQAIGDNGRDQRLIRTVHGRGFRFVGDVRDLDGDVGATPDRIAVTTAFGPGVVDWAGPLARLVAGTGGAIELIGRGPDRRTAIDDLLHQADEAGLLIARGRGAGELRVHASVLEALDEVITRRPSVLLGLPDPVRTELHRVLEGGEPSTRQRLFLAARELVAASARTGGLVVAIEDVHLIDRSTVELLLHLVRGARRLPVLIVATHRAGYVLDAGMERVELDADATEVDALPSEVEAVLEHVAVLGEAPSREAAEVATGLEPGPARRALELAQRAGVLEATPSGLQFVDPAAADRLAARLSASERAGVHRRVAAHLDRTGAPAAAVADHLVAAGELTAAAPHQVRAAEVAAQHRRHDEVLARTAVLPDDLDRATRQALLELRADALSDLGDVDGVRCYREALHLAGPAAAPWLRARLARALVRVNDVTSAQEALAGIDVEASDHPGVRLVAAMVRYLTGDLDETERLLDGLRGVALAPGAPAELLDVIAMQGMVAHSRGMWFDRLRTELRIAQRSEDLARTVFDAHICVAQYLLYGPTGLADVIALADDLRRSAEAIGARPAMAFAETLEGEARLLAGDLEGARATLERAVTGYRAASADTGTAHALQRLAEVHLHLGDRAGSEQLLQQALPLARWSPLSQHLLQRVFGSLIAAAEDPVEAATRADDALATTDGPESCEFCQVMLAVPAAQAFAGVGRFDDARAQLEVANRVAVRWEGPAWPAAVAEADAVLARAEGREDDADRLFRRAAREFEAAGQVLDAARCREAI